jgi:uncharacterized Fe-S cluster protein YjdI
MWIKTLDGKLCNADQYAKIVLAGANSTIYLISANKELESIYVGDNKELCELVRAHIEACIDGSKQLCRIADTPTLKPHGWVMSNE